MACDCILNICFQWGQTLKTSIFPWSPNMFCPIYHIFFGNPTSKAPVSSKCDVGLFSPSPSIPHIHEEEMCNYRWASYYNWASSCKCIAIGVHDVKCECAQKVHVLQTLWVVFTPLIVFLLSILYGLCYLWVFVHAPFSQSQLNSCCCFNHKVRNVFFPFTIHHTNGQANVKPSWGLLPCDRHANKLPIGISAWIGLLFTLFLHHMCGLNEEWGMWRAWSIHGSELQNNGYCLLCKHLPYDPTR